MAGRCAAAVICQSHIPVDTILGGSDVPTFIIRGPRAEHSPPSPRRTSTITPALESVLVTGKRTLTCSYSTQPKITVTISAVDA